MVELSDNSNLTGENTHVSDKQEALDGHGQELLKEEAGHGEESQEHTLFAEPIFNIGNFTVTNSLLTSWVAVILIIILSLAIRVKNSRVPSVFQSGFEKIMDGALDMMDSVTGDRTKSERVFPLIFAIFIFVLINNWMGLLPGIGSITFNGQPMFRGGTADLNTTLAMGLFSVVAANVFGVIVVGGWKYFNKFVNLRALAAIPGKVKKDWTVIIVNPIM